MQRNHSIICLPALLLFLQGTAFAQLVTFSGTGNLPVPPGAPAQTVGVTQSTCSVTGVGIIGTCVTIENVEIDLEHTFDGDIGILLIGPGGQVLELSTGNGGGGNNFTNTVFTDNTGSFITTGTPPFTGTFRPEGRVTNLTNPYSNAPALGTHTFANTYNGTNGDGAWTLYINDYVSFDIGLLISWSITFNLGGVPPVANAGPDVSRCSGQSAALSATGGGTYTWSTGETTANISVAPTMTTTYTVTVSAAGCGTDTDEVTVTVNPTPSISLMPLNPNLCQGDCQTIIATLTGTPPFNLTYRTISSNGTITTLTKIFNSLSEPFLVCPPAATLGSFQVQAINLTDANCTCN